MALVQSRTIENLQVLNDGNNIVCSVEVRYTSYDDTDQERTTIESSRNFRLNTEDVTTETEGFVAFESLTAEIVEGWIAEKLNDNNIHTNQAAWIDSVLNPPAPRTVNKANPW